VVSTWSGYRDGGLRDTIPSRVVVVLPEGEEVDATTQDSEEGNQTESITEEAWSATPTPGKEGMIDVTPTPRPIPRTQIPTPILEAAPAPTEGIGVIICSYPWDCATATAVACSESGLDPLESNPSGAKGLFQLMPVHAWRFTARGWNYWTDWDDPVKNAAIAYEIWIEQGWAPWMSSWPWSCN